MFTRYSSKEDLDGANLEGVRCDSHAVCLPGTRRSLMQDVMRWIAKPDGQHVLWLHGVFGSGKSTFANTVASRYMDMGLLGASFRFSKNIDGHNVRMLVFRNIAYQLALFNG